MKSTLIKLAFFGAGAWLLGLTACKKKSNPDAPSDPSAISFDRKGLLTNMVNNLIIPSYQALNASVLRLDSSIAGFNANPGTTTLLNAQNAFKSAYLAWQSCSQFNVGPANQLFLGLNVNTFPTDTTVINKNISSAGYNLATLVNQPAKGFPAIDYLLFAGSDVSVIITRYTNDSKASGRKQYLAAVSADIKANVKSVFNQWQSGYINAFINATGTDVGSSLGQLINAVDFDLEILKNDKMGIPLGKQSQGSILPEKAEAYYSGISVQLALAQLSTLQDIYLGKSTLGGDGLGFDDYLIALKAQYSSGALNDAVKNQFTSAVTDLGKVPDPLAQTVQSNPGVVNTAYVDLQKLVVLLKTDMPSAMGVLITYEDTDGD